MPKATVLITDLDNTLWDWVQIWHASFKALIDVLVKRGKLDRDQLLAEARGVHQRHGTSEYSLLLEELPSFQALSEKTNPAELRDQAIQAFRDARNRFRDLYPGVRETLDAVHRAGSLIVGYTESMAFATSQRIRKLDLDGVLDFLYSSPDHDFPEDVPPEAIRQYSGDHYDLKVTKHRHVEQGVTKPNVEVLNKILRDVEADPSETVYLGDSLMKDIAMAQDAGVMDVLAVYGAAQNTEAYELLRRVTHWSDADVEKEKGPQRNPSRRIDSFPELLDLFEFTRHSGEAA